MKLIGLRRMLPTIIRWFLLAFAGKRMRVKSEAELGNEAAFIPVPSAAILKAVRRRETHEEFMARAREQVAKLRAFYGRRPRPWRPAANSPKVRG